MARRNSDSGRLAVIWLATAFVVVIGAGASAFVIIAASDQPEGPFVVWGVSFAGLILVLLAMSIRWDRPVSRLQLWLSTKDRSDPTDAYRAARRRTKSREQFGSNEPPSIESVRDAANHGGAWVPHSSQSSRDATR